MAQSHIPLRCLSSSGCSCAQDLLTASKARLADAGQGYGGRSLSTSTWWETHMPCELGLKTDEVIGRAARAQQVVDRITGE